MTGRLFALAFALSLNACAPAATAEADAGATVAPPATGGIALVNRAEALRSMDVRYDLLLRDAGITGTVELDLALNADGSVHESRVAKSTHSRFSQTALEVAPDLRFTPPAQSGAVVRVRMNFVHRRGEIDVLRVRAGSPARPVTDL